MPYSFHVEAGHTGPKKVAIFNRDKDRVVAHTEAPTRDEAIAKAKKVAGLRQWFAEHKGA